MSQLARMQNFSLRRAVPLCSRGKGGEETPIPGNWPKLKVSRFYVQVAYPKHNSMLITNMQLVFVNFVGKIWIRAIFAKVIFVILRYGKGCFAFYAGGKAYPTQNLALITMVTLVFADTSWKFDKFP